VRAKGVEEKSHEWENGVEEKKRVNNGQQYKDEENNHQTTNGDKEKNRRRPNGIGKMKNHELTVESKTGTLKRSQK
jgi:hypothetical protein